VVQSFRTPFLWACNLHCFRKLHPKEKGSVFQIFNVKWKLHPFQSVQPVLLDGLFFLAEPIVWNKTQTVITYGSQPLVDAFLEEHFCSQVDNCQKFGKYRMYELGPIHTGEEITLTTLGDELVDTLLYDENYTFMPSDYRGIIPVRYESGDAFLLLYLKPEPENGEPIIRIARNPSSGFIAYRQAVLINFSGLNTTSTPQSFPDYQIQPFYNSAGQKSIIQSFQKRFYAYDLILGRDKDYMFSEPYSTVYIGTADPPIPGPYVGEGELTHPQDRNRDMKEVARVIRGKTDSFSIEKRCVRKDGHVIWVGVHGFALRDYAGRTIRIMAMIEDVTARKRAESRHRDVQTPLKKTAPRKNSRSGANAQVDS
ncbi:MAG: PAS domain S-box protein, partial [Phycisphaerae bacterium]